jgi:hypothetical protein
LEADYRAAARLYRLAYRVGKSGTSVHVVERAAGILQSLAAARASTRDVGRAAQRVIDDAQRLHFESTAAWSLAQAARWLVDTRAELAKDLYVAGLIVGLAGAARYESVEGVGEPVARALVRQLALMEAHAEDGGATARQAVDEALSRVGRELPQFADLIRTFYRVVASHQIDRLTRTSTDE